jgi:alpha/beta superfamily hydrolase
VREEVVLDEEHVTFASGELRLEGLYAHPCGGPPARVVVICHPHPMYGGSMHNNVVEAILKGAWQAGYATLRFNFRGVGASEGEYDGGEGEVLDARAAVKFIASQPGVIPDQFILGGYSFGAAMAMRAGLTDPAVVRIIAVALPVGMMASGAEGEARKPVLLISGDSDSYSPEARVRAVTASLGTHARVEIISGADHFFGGFEDAVTAAIAGALE